MTKNATSRTAAYRVEVEFAPAYELVTSFHAYIDRRTHNSIELGPGWAQEVRKRLDPALAGELAWITRPGPLNLPYSLVRHCPGERDADGFLRWLGSLPAADLHDLLTRWGPAGVSSLPQNLGTVRDRAVRLLGLWNEHYFRKMDPDILSGLAESAAATGRKAEVAPDPEDLVETVTAGLRLDPTPESDLERVVLIPQYHLRPLNLHSWCRGTLVVLYSADPLAAAPGEPPASLLRATRALADESRLRILNFLARGPSSFTEIVRATRLAKSTVHHHLAVLRAAGLVRVHAGPGRADRFSLRPSALAELQERLGTFLVKPGAGAADPGGPADPHGAAGRPDDA